MSVQKILKYRKYLGSAWYEKFWSIGKKKNVTRWVAVPNLQELPLKLTASPCIFIGLNYGT